MEKIVNYANPKYDMLLTDFRTLISTEPDGIELKAIGELCNLKFSWYYSYKQNGVIIRYFILTKARMRPILKYLQGNLRNRSKFTVYIVSRFFIEMYIKKGTLRELNLEYNLSRMIQHRLPYILMQKIFNIKVFRKDFIVDRTDGLEYKVNIQGMIFSVKFQKKAVKAYLNGDEIELEKVVREYVNRYKENNFKSNLININR